MLSLQNHLLLQALQPAILNLLLPQNVNVHDDMYPTSTYTLASTIRSKIYLFNSLPTIQITVMRSTAKNLFVSTHSLSAVQRITKVHIVLTIRSDVMVETIVRMVMMRKIVHKERVHRKSSAAIMDDVCRRCGCGKMFIICFSKVHFVHISNDHSAMKIPIVKMEVTKRIAKRRTVPTKNFNVSLVDVFLCLGCVMVSYSMFFTYEILLKLSYCCR